MIRVARTTGVRAAAAQRAMYCGLVAPLLLTSCAFALPLQSITVPLLLASNLAALPLAVTTLAVMNLDTLMWTCLVLVLVLGPLFTLWWWKIGDKWADAEHKRFHEKPDTREKVVMKSARDDNAPGGT